MAEGPPGGFAAGRRKSWFAVKDAFKLGEASPATPPPGSEKVAAAASAFGSARGGAQSFSSLLDEVWFSKGGISGQEDHQKLSVVQEQLDSDASQLDEVRRYMKDLQKLMGKLEAANIEGNLRESIRTVKAQMPDRVIGLERLTSHNHDVKAAWLAMEAQLARSKSATVVKPAPPPKSVSVQELEDRLSAKDSDLKAAVDSIGELRDLLQEARKTERAYEERVAALEKSIKALKMDKRDMGHIVQDVNDLLFQAHQTKFKMSHISTLAQGFYQWYQRAKRNKRRRNHLSRFLLYWKDRRAARTLNRWRAYVRELRVFRGKATGAIRKMQNRGLHLGFEAWKAHTREVRRQRATCQKVIRRIQNRSLFNAFGTWMGETEHSREEKRARERQEQTAKRILLRIRNLGMALGFEAWTFYVADLHHKRALANKVVLRMAQVKLHAALGRWQMYTEEVVRMKKLINKSLGYMRHRALRMAFEDWQDHFFD